MMEYIQPQVKIPEFPTVDIKSTVEEMTNVALRTQEEWINRCMRLYGYGPLNVSEWTLCRIHHRPYACFLLYLGEAVGVFDIDYSGALTGRIVFNGFPYVPEKYAIGCPVQVDERARKEVPV